jgi:hypothetical protein
LSEEIKKREATHQEDIILILYASNFDAPNFIKQTLPEIKGCVDANRIIVYIFNSPLSSIDGSSRQNIKKETLELTTPSSKLNRHLWHILSNNGRKHILLSSPWNILHKYMTLDKS